ncbi:MAG: hypothetical protein E7100_00455 [Bacteroidaceae bacterium]|jgi:hypothetical protein|nr:hypothetical protein [Bacteroidaceae bacterium]
MKKTLRSLMMGMMALLAGNALTSCSSDDEPQVAQQEGKTGYVEFTISRGADTRVDYTFNETTKGLDATWSADDKMVVVYETESDRIVEVFDLVEGAGEKTAKFAKSDSQLTDKSGTVGIQYLPDYTSGIDIDKYTRDISNQEGNLKSLGKYDCFLFNATLNNGKIESSTFQPLMAILHFPKGFDFGITATKVDLVFGGGASIIIPEVTEGDITVKDVTLTDGKLDNDIYVVVLNYMSVGAPTTLKVGEKTFALPKIAEAGMIYTFAESNLKEMDKEPLTLEPVSSDVTITIKNPLELTIEYSVVVTGDETLVPTKASTITIDVKKGERLQLFSQNASLSNGSSSTQILCDADCYIYGNIMSLIDDGNDGYDTDKVIAGNFALLGLFQNNTHIRNHDRMALLLPATTLAEYCYYDMFNGCTGLTVAPTLPATTLANGCYATMFYECTSLTIAPTLPATKLAAYCYTYMFKGCTSLTSAPALPATKLEFSCYSSMFEGCTSLTSAPALPAIKLADFCYGSMFEGCTSLNAVTCLAINISASGCTTDWLKGVSASGTFTKASSMTSWGSDDSGIPAGWTVANYGE